MRPKSFMFYKPLGKFHQICNFGAFREKYERILIIYNELIILYRIDTVLILTAQNSFTIS